MGNIIVGETINNQYLWTDQKSQRDNLAKLTNTNNGWVVSPENQVLLDKISTKIVENTSKTSFEETFSKWLDSLIDTFGPLLVSVLRMFGYSKWRLM